MLMARRIVALSSVMLRKITGVRMPRLRIASHTAKPSRSGSCRSRTMSCGQPDSAIITASAPVTAILVSNSATSNASRYIAARSLRSSTSRTCGLDCILPASTSSGAHPRTRGRMVRPAPHQNQQQFTPANDPSSVEIDATGRRVRHSRQPAGARSGAGRPGARPARRRCARRRPCAGWPASCRGGGPAAAAGLALGARQHRRGARRTTAAGEVACGLRRPGGRPHARDARSGAGGLAHEPAARVARRRVAVVHATPGDCWPIVEHDAPDEKLREVYGAAGVQNAIYGHIHHAYVRELGGLKVANSGSVSLSLDADMRACYALVDGGRIEHRRVEYDIERVASDFDTIGYPNAKIYARWLRTGKYPSQ